jgi:hypothetical protein
MGERKIREWLRNPYELRHLWGHTLLNVAGSSTVALHFVRRRQDYTRDDTFFGTC